MRSVSEITDFDNFFYYGMMDLDHEIESDIFIGLQQGERSMFYNRQEGCSMETMENYPNTIIAQIGMRYSIMNYLAWRNGEVGDGTNGTRERRVACSQAVIGFEKDEKGNLDVSVLYIPFANYKDVRFVNVPIIGGANV